MKLFETLALKSESTNYLYKFYNAKLRTLEKAKKKLWQKGDVEVITFQYYPYTQNQQNIDIEYKSVTQELCMNQKE